VAKHSARSDMYIGNGFSYTAVGATDSHENGNGFSRKKHTRAGCG